jgi:hypothetical protein
MALENILARVGGKAVASLATKQYYALQLVSGTDYGFNLATAATQKPGGILQNAPAINQAVDACFLGISKYVAGGTVAVGDKLTANSSGKLVATTTDKDCIWGIALTAADADDVASMWVGGLAGMVSAT